MARITCPRTEKARRQRRLARSGRPKARAAGRGGCNVTIGRGSGRVGPGRRATRAGPRQGRRGPIATGRSGRNPSAAEGTGVDGKGRRYQSWPIQAWSSISDQGVSAASQPLSIFLLVRVRNLSATASRKAAGFSFGCAQAARLAPPATAILIRPAGNHLASTARKEVASRIPAQFQPLSSFGFFQTFQRAYRPRIRAGRSPATRAVP